MQGVLVFRHGFRVFPQTPVKAAAWYQRGVLVQYPLALRQIAPTFLKSLQWSIYDQPKPGGNTTHIATHNTPLRGDPTWMQGTRSNHHLKAQGTVHQGNTAGTADSACANHPQNLMFTSAWPHTSLAASHSSKNIAKKSARPQAQHT